MTGYLTIVVPVAVVMVLAVIVGAWWLMGRSSGTRGVRRGLADDVSQSLVAAAGYHRGLTIPVKQVANRPPWALTAAYDPDADMPDWADPAADRVSGFGWNSGSGGPPHPGDLHAWQSDIEDLAGPGQAGPQQPRQTECTGQGTAAAPARVTVAARVSVAAVGDESEPEPAPAPPTAATVALMAGERFRADLFSEAFAFMTRQDAEVRAYLSAYRMRWQVA